MHDPDRGHWEAVKWILRYIKGIIDIELVFEKDTNSKQECTRNVGFDYAGDFERRRSMTRYVFTLSQAPESWRSTLQSTVALSTIETEYMAMTKVIKKGI